MINKSVSDHLREDKYVAYLDVLGFKELVKHGGAKLDDYFETVTKTLGDINSEKASIESQLVSDATILACPLLTEDLRSLLTAIQTIQSRCAVKNIWIRGGVSIGPIHYDLDLNIVVGNGLVAAYLLEQQAEFPRVIIDPKILMHDDFRTKDRFILTFNNTFPGPGSQINRIPLVHNNRGDYGYRYIDVDSIFVAFADKIAFNNVDDLEIIYTNIQEQLYAGQSNYRKYLWLKNYFTEALALIGGTVEIDDKPFHPNQGKILELANEFRLL